MAERWRRSRQQLTMVVALGGAVALLPLWALLLALLGLSARSRPAAPSLWLVAPRSCPARAMGRCQPRRPPLAVIEGGES